MQFFSSISWGWEDDSPIHKLKSCWLCRQQLGSYILLSFSFISLSLFWNGLFQKKSKQGDGGGGGSCGYTFLKKTLESFIFLLYPWKFHTKQSSTPGYSTKLCQIPWNFQGQKQIPLEIPHYFFLVTLGNSTSFLINPWKFHMLFLGYHWEFHILNSPPPRFGFSLE